MRLNLSQPAFTFQLYVWNSNYVKYRPCNARLYTRFTPTKTETVQWVSNISSRGTPQTPVWPAAALVNVSGGVKYWIFNCILRKLQLPTVPRFIIHQRKRVIDFLKMTDKSFPVFFSIYSNFIIVTFSIIYTSITQIKSKECCGHIFHLLERDLFIMQKKRDAVET